MSDIDLVLVACVVFIMVAVSLGATKYLKIASRENEMKLKHKRKESKARINAALQSFNSPSNKVRFEGYQILLEEVSENVEPTPGGLMCIAIMAIAIWNEMELKQ